MPELPEVETVRRTLLPHVRYHTIVDIHVHDTRMRIPIDTALLTQHVCGKQICNIRRRAKYLLFDVAQHTHITAVLMIHLGMSGRLSVLDAAQPLQKHDHVVWSFGNGYHMRFNDPRRFGLVDIFTPDAELLHPRLCKLGIEPLHDNNFSGALLYQLTRHVKKPIKNFLMDAHQVVGIGNIYACEALFAAGIHPKKAAGRISYQQCERLVGAVQQVLQQAIAAGGSTLRDFVDANAQAGYFASSFQVYGRTNKSCVQCQKPIKRMVQAGRSTFYCTTCQH